MRQNLFALISFILFIWTVPCAAGPVIVTISDSQVSFRNRILFPRHISAIKKLTAETNIDVKFISLDLQSLDNLKAELDKVIGEDDVLSGIILLGHGSKEAYFLSKNVEYKGTDIARILGRALKDRPLSENFLVYMSSCFTGSPSKDNSNFLDSLGSELLDFKNQGLRTNEIALIGHIYPTSYSGLRPANLMQDLIIRMVPKTLKRGFQKIAPAYGMLYPLLIGFLAVEVGFLGDVFFSVPNHLLTFTIRDLALSSLISAPFIPISSAFEKIVRKITVRDDGSIKVQEGVGNEVFSNSLAEACDGALSSINKRPQLALP